MLPVMAETFINLLIFSLANRELKIDKQKYQSFVSDTITNRLKLLHVHCQGFELQVDHAHNACRDFYQLMNDRNDLLHGNFNVQKLKIGEVYFSGKTPVKYEYGDLWDDTIGISANSVKLGQIENSYAWLKSLLVIFYH